MTEQRLFLALGCVFCLINIQGQTSGIPFIQNYKPRVYKASSANYDIVQDSRGIMYFANYRGILEYDGVNWRLFPLSNGTAARSLATDELGTVYVAGVAEMGYMVPDSMGKLGFRSFLPMIDTTFYRLPEAIEVFGDKRGAWFRGMEAGQLYHWTGDSLVHYPITQTGPEYAMFTAGGHLYAHSPIDGLLKWKAPHFEPITGGRKLRGYQLQGIKPLSPTKWLAYDRNNGFVKITLTNNQMNVQEWKTDLTRRQEQFVFTEMHPLSDGRISVGSVKQGLFILSEDGSIVQHLVDGQGLQDNFILATYEDHQGILWLALSKGISWVDVSAPLSQWNESSGLMGIVFSAMHHQDRLYVATTLGVFGFDGESFQPVSGLGIETWSMDVVRTGGRERLLAHTVRGIYEIQGFDAKLIPGGTGFFRTLASRTYPGYAFALSGSVGMEMLTHNGREWIFPDEAIRVQGRFMAMVETHHQELWLQELLNPLVLTRTTLAKDQPRILKSETIRLPDTFPMPQGVYLWQDDISLATEKGIYVFDRQTQTFVPETSIGISGPYMDTGVLRLSEDETGRVWIERYQDNKRWLELAIPTSDNRYERDSVALRELSDVEVWGEVYSGPNGHAWIGTPEGLFVYNIQAPQRPKTVFRPLIRQVISGQDSVLYHGFPPDHDEIPELPYQDNGLTFHFAAPYYKSESEVQYSYFLDGWDKSWSSWKSEFKKDYTLLPPGDYVFRVKARNLYAQKSAESAYAFRIAAPWYRTPWAFVGYLFALGLLVYGTVKFNTQRLHTANEHLEKIVYERTSELWAQHKEIIKKSAELKRQKEAISQQHELLGEKNQELESTLAQLKSAQSKLVESEKMASLGQLTAGIAHEINNPINFVKGNVGPLKRDFEEVREIFTRLQEVDPSDRKEVAEKLTELKAYCQKIDAPFLFEEMDMLLKGIEEGAQRTKQIVDGLKVFSRADADAFNMADIHQCIESTLTLLSNNLKNRFEIHQDYASLPQIECMPGKLNQVFMNIVSNAVEAMEEQAGPGAKTTREKIGDLYIQTQEVDFQGNPGVEIRIRDTGAGIPENMLSRIFDPFFTTKDVGQGTGLGLSISFGIIEKHGGTIEVASPKNGGTEFVIRLPQQQES